MSRFHPFTILEIDNKEVEIDNEIYDLIKLMNSLPGLKTIACCQGDPDDQPSPKYPPYIAFSCSNNDTLNVLRRAMRLKHTKFEKNHWYFTISTRRFDEDNEFALGLEGKFATDWFYESLKEVVNSHTNGSIV